MKDNNIEILYEVYAASGLGKWFKEKWIDLSRKKKGGGHPACGASAGKGVRKKSKSKKYPKCVPASRAAGMSKKEKASAVRRKRAAGNKGKKPNWVSTKPTKEVFIATENNMRVNELLKFLNEETKPSKRMVKENNIVETIRALVLEELAKEAATPDGATGTTPTGAAAAPAAGAPQAPAPVSTSAAAPPAAAPASVDTAPAAPAAGQTASTPATGVTPAPAPVAEMKTLEEELDEAFGLAKEDAYAPEGYYQTPDKHEDESDEGVAGRERDGMTDPAMEEAAVPTGTVDAGGVSAGNVTPMAMAPTEELEECGSYENELEENLFAESKNVRGRVLSESTKNGELLMQERRRKQLIQVQNKILYSKR